MIYTDTRDKSVKTDFKTAVVGGMNEKTGGLYIPVEFPKLDKSFLNKNPEQFRKTISKNSSTRHLLSRQRFQVSTQIHTSSNFFTVQHAHSKTSGPVLWHV